MPFFSNHLRLRARGLLSVAALAISPALAEPNYEPIYNYHPTSIFAQVGQPVGRLRTTTDRGASGCTAFLISTRHMITNEHCVGERYWNRDTKEWMPRQILSVTLEMGVVDPNDQTSVETFAVQMPPLEMDEALDYAILSIVGNPADTYGFLSISAETPRFKTPLWIIGHPKLKVQQISRLHCRVIKHPRPHRRRLHHTCPTEGGNSGSPVFDASTGNVIAINNAHYSAEIRDIGLAVPFSLIAEQSAILRSIIDGQ